MALLWLLLCFTLIGTSPGSGAPASKPELSDKPRNIYGKDALPGLAPWLLTIMTTDRIQICGGTLINEYWAITSTHCNVTTSDLVVTGKYDSHSCRTGIQTLKIAQVFLHPGLHWNPIDYDISLLKLESPAHFSNDVFPAFLPTVSDRFPPGLLCMILGWGLTDHNAGKYGRIVERRIVPVLSNTECEKHWCRINTDAKICTAESFASCYDFDLGGSLVCKKEKVYTVVGVLSFMSETCPSLKPVVFTRVTKIVPWIQETMANN